MPCLQFEEYYFWRIFRHASNQIIIFTACVARTPLIKDVSGVQHVPVFNTDKSDYV